MSRIEIELATFVKPENAKPKIPNAAPQKRPVPLIPHPLSVPKPADTPPMKVPQEPKVPSGV